MMPLPLTWMPPEAPYMPVATAGLLSFLDGARYPARARWIDRDGLPELVVETPLSADEIASLLIETPWPSLDRIPWPEGTGSSVQAIKPVLARAEDPTATFRRMVAASPPLEATFLRALLTDAVVDSQGVPARSRLLRGVKSDLSGIANRPRRLVASELAAELRDGPDFRGGSSGLGLGLVPEVQTFGGTTGPDASTVGGYSPLLYLLLWQGIMALPPVAVSRDSVRSVGGPLVTGPDVLSWPVWRMPAGIRSLRTLFCLATVHAEEFDLPRLRARSIDAVYRAKAVQLSTMVAVFGWGRQVARRADRSHHGRP